MSQQANKELMETRVLLAEKRPWYWLRDCVCTLDEHDPTTLAKPFPNKAMYRVVTRVWQECPILFIEKSRQVMMTWIMAALNLWDAMTLKARLILFQSKNQKDANKVLKRAKHIYESACAMGIPWLPEAKWTGDKLGTAAVLEFPSNKSEIQAIPQGEDIVRSNTCSRIFDDEMNHQDQFEEAYAAAKPTITGGGNFLGQGTANGRTFGYYMLHGIDERTLKPMGPHKLDSDKVKNKRFVAPEGLTVEQKRRWIEKKIVDLDEEEFYSIPLEELVACLPGMRYWRTAAGTHCLRVHYSADPDKSPDTEAGRAWIVEAKESMSVSKWEREYEIRYDTFEGRPVLPQFTRALFVHKLEYDSNYPLFLAADFGSSCGCLFGQIYPIPDYNVKRVKLLDEIFEEQSDTPQLAEAIIEKLKARFRRSFENNNLRFFCDPAGNQQRETTSDKSMNSSIKILNAYGLYPDSQKFGIPESVQFVDAMFSRILPDGLPAVLVDECCEYFIGVFAGGWHFPKVKSGAPVKSGYPEKDGLWEHGGDMTRIMLCNALDEFDVSGKERKVTQTQYVRRRHTGEIMGRRRSGRINPKRGEHAIRPSY